MYFIGKGPHGLEQPDSPEQIGSAEEVQAIVLWFIGVACLVLAFFNPTFIIVFLLFLLLFKD